MNIYLDLFLTFFKIGLFTFGGGYAMLPFIQEETIAHGWITEAALVDFIAVSESTPGPFAINIATYIGAETGGVLGSACATLGVVMPSVIVILIVAKCYEKFKSSKIVSGCMSGLKPAVVGMIGAAVLSVGETAFFTGGLTTAVFTQISFYCSLLIFAIAAVLAFTKKHPILIVCLSAVMGIAFGYLLGLPTT